MTTSAAQVRERLRIAPGRERGVAAQSTEPSTCTSNKGIDFHEGLNHLDGEQALAYVQQRHGLPNGDLDRAKREQNALRALLSKAGESTADPLALLRLADAASKTVSVDDTLSNGGLRSLAVANSGLRPGAVVFASAPVASFGREGAQSVDYLDAAACAELWEAVRTGKVADYVSRHPSASLGSTPN